MGNLRNGSAFSARWATGFRGRQRSGLIVVAIIFGLCVPNIGAAQSAPPKTRKAVFAGSFYPGDKTGLGKAVDGYLTTAAANAPAAQDPVFGIIAPHAGYEYSGQVAAYAYSQLKGRAIKTVIIMGSSHQVGFKGVAIDPVDQWETPLGSVSVNREIADSITERYRFIKAYPPAFQREHSLEVQLPFLQRTLSNFSIVPLVLGSMDEQDYAVLSDALLAQLNKNPQTTLIVASSDMSHFHPYKQAVRMDNRTLKDIETLNLEKVKEAMEKGDSELCGAQAVITLMSVARRLNAESRILRYANSGDVTRDMTRVVGYGAAAFSYRDRAESLSTREQTMLLSIARKSLEASVLEKAIPQPDIKDKRLLDKRGAFVTLTKKGDLRGCIGYIQPVQPLYKAVSEMAIAASTRDPRFPPVSKEDLKNIHIEISVLTPLRPIADVKEIEVGTHGLYIVKGGYSGLLLPQVAVTYKWNRDEFLKQTCVKAGLPPNAWKEKDTRIYTFSAEIFEE